MQYLIRERVEGEWGYEQLVPETHLRRILSEAYTAAAQFDHDWELNVYELPHNKQEPVRLHTRVVESHPNHTMLELCHSHDEPVGNGTNIQFTYYQGD